MTESVPRELRDWWATHWLQTLLSGGVITVAVGCAGIYTQHVRGMEVIAMQARTIEKQQVAIDEMERRINDQRVTTGNLLTSIEASRREFDQLRAEMRAGFDRLESALLGRISR